MAKFADATVLTGTFYLGKWLVKPASNELVYKSESRRLDQKVMRLLVFFVQHSGEELTKEDLLAGVWGEGVHNDEVLTVAVSALRKGLDDDPKAPQFIKTIPRHGYIFFGTIGEVPTSRHKNIWRLLEERVGLRFLIVSGLIGFVLLIVLVQVFVEIVYYMAR